ncbi:MAG TPA: transporter [Gemmatimonadales bacterium]|nr:transporter [Gemmatimonadales bacterium]
MTPARAAGLLAAAALGLAPVPARAQGIRDNSFLLEEAYNQEAGVVQHVGVLHHAEAGRGWLFTFSQEWPLWSQRHQLSYSVPFTGGSDQSGLGDVGVHYRYQLLGGGAERLAVAPRLSAFVPTGNTDDATGSGSVGVQVGLPASVELGPRFAGHVNVAATLTPSSENPAGGAATAFDLAAGASLVWLAAPWMNFLVEGVWARVEEVTGPGATSARNSTWLNPGVRFAWNLPGGRQVVPGLSYTFGVGPETSGESLLLVYLSFEHPFSAAGTPAGTPAGHLRGAAQGVR